MNYPAIPREFFNGDCFDAYRILGAHPCSDNGTEGWRFAVWAPGATAVEVCGGFDGWEAGVPMEKADTGVWSAFVPGLAEGDLYKYRVHGADGSVVMRSDPYAFSTELRPGTATLRPLDWATSIICCTRWILEAKVATTMRLLCALRNSCSKLSPTLRSLMV